MVDINALAKDIWGLCVDEVSLEELTETIRSSPALASKQETCGGVVDEIAAERQRQKDVEGWTPEHDDKYQCMELSKAAASYCLATKLATTEKPPSVWPWHKEWWKPTTRRRNLIKAAALIVADIERLDRSEGHALTATVRGDVPVFIADGVQVTAEELKDLKPGHVVVLETAHRPVRGDCGCGEVIDGVMQHYCGKHVDAVKPAPVTSADKES